MALDHDATLVLACYNHEAFVDQALESIAAQTLRPRLIVTDDASTDGTVAALTEGLQRLGLEAQVIAHSQNMGICRTFNEALDAVTTPYVAFLSADDWLEATRTERQVAQLKAAGPATALAHSDMYVHSDESVEPSLYSTVWPDATNPNPAGNPFKEMIRANFIATPSVMLRTAAARKVGGFDNELPFEDYDLYLRLAREYEFTFDPTPLVHYRRHGANMTDDNSPIRKVKWLKAILRIYSKQLGVDKEVDRIAAIRMYDAACQLYKLGEGRPRSYVKHFLRYTKATRSPRGLLFAALAWIGIPGSSLPMAKSDFWA